MHFKIYLGFNSGLILVAGYLLKLSLENNNTFISSTLPFILPIPILGMFFSLAWFLVANNDREVQLNMNKTLEDIENEIFKDEKLGLFHNINKYYSTKDKIDIIDINVYIAFFFYVIWLFARFYLFLSLDIV